ncbi:MAG: ABC-F family ATP-binding cassette domain-containing protein [Rubrobacter sp.]|nr:ABC-F family ATP-binding cassette domain-containing protein [Rubrobacter sp.]
MIAQWQNISLAFPDKRVLDNVSLTVYPNDRIALLGDNGAGKTSLLRILMGRIPPDSGTVSMARGASVGYLEQSLAAVEDSNPSCMDAALEAFAELRDLENEISALNARLASADGDTPRLLEELGEAQQRFESSGGYEFRARAEAALTNLGLSEEVWERAVSCLSAGQKVRLALAKVLLEDHGLLVLDEPTNHLDIEARTWLEEELRGMDSTVVVASHDRRFLDAVSEKVVHLEGGSIKTYPGNYSAFRRQRDERLEADWNVYEKRRKTAGKLKKQARAYAGWSKNREKDKQGAYDKGFVGHRAAKLMKRSLHAQRRLEKTIEDMEAEKPFEKDAVKVEFHGKKGRTLLAAGNVAVGYERPLAENVSFALEGGDRLAVLGPNGSGKTTLLRTLLGELPPLSGEIKTSPSASVGYFDQENRMVEPRTPALRAVLDTGCDETLARTVMGRMRVKRATVHKPFGALSAGEKAKVLLTRLILGEHDLLVLDEPTNYLDIETQDVLLDALGDFPGGMLFVSHDRHFVEALATEVVELG